MHKKNFNKGVYFFAKNPIELSDVKDKIIINYPKL